MGLFRRKPKDRERSRRGSSATTDRSVFSYYQNRVIPGDESVKATSERKKKQLAQMKRHHLPTLAALIVIVGCFIYILTLSPQPKIIIVNEQDKATQSLLRSTDAYKQAAQNILQSSLFNKSKITINTAGVARELQKQFPEISEATVSLPLINRRPVIYLQITKPAFLVTRGSDIYAIDEQGRVIMKGDATIPASDLARIEDQTSQEATVGKAFLPASQVDFLQNVQTQLQSKGISQVSFVLPPLANEVYVKMKDKPYFVKMTFAADPRLQAGTFLAVKQKLEADKVTPAEYIDVRVEDRAYYR